MGTGGTILKTSNGGQSLLAQSSGTWKNLISVHFSDSQNGWAVGQSGTILKTSNGDQSWLQSIGRLPAVLYSVHFSNAQGSVQKTV